MVLEYSSILGKGIKMRYIPKPWGYELIWAEVKGKYIGKVLHINKGHRISLQLHKFKDESMYFFKGLVLVTVGETETIYNSGSINISAGVKHRVEALEDSEIFEVSTFFPDDILHLDDDYNRG